jgi:hypothetical protein
MYGHLSSGSPILRTPMCSRVDFSTIPSPRRDFGLRGIANPDVNISLALQPAKTRCGVPPVHSSDACGPLLLSYPSGYRGSRFLMHCFPCLVIHERPIPIFLLIHDTRPGRMNGPDRPTDFPKCKGQKYSLM